MTPGKFPGKSPGHSPGRPYLSIVATARNDDHGGNLLGRMQWFVDSLLGQCDRFGLDAELILVEWNPPPDRLRFSEALRFAYSDHCNIRIITVPPEIHGRYLYAQQLPLFQMIAKNVGIRRSCGSFVLATNIDILFSDALIQRIAHRDLRDDRMYRVDRHDIAAIPQDVADPLEFAGKHVLRINARNGTTNLQTGAFHRIYKPLTWRQRLMDLRLWPVTTHTRLHTNACGDFTLMHRDRWFALRGYAEFAMYSMHLDSLLCHAAHHGGARECVLPGDCRAYHIEHSPGSGFSPEHKAALDARLADAGVPQMSHAEFAMWARTMRRRRRPVLFNGPDWGLADVALAYAAPLEAREDAHLPRKRRCG